MALKSKPMEQVRTVPVHVVSEEEMVRINLNVPESLRHAWKQIALNQKKTLTEVIIDAMNKYSNE